MATPIFQAQPPSFNLNPLIIPPTAGDLEEARIRRLTDFAKLRELTLAPGFEQQRLDIAKSGQTAEAQYRTGVLGETQSHNVAEEKHWADLLGLDHAKLQETAREHDSALGELTDYHKGVLKNQLAGDFMAHIAQLYTGDPTKVAESTGALTPILDKLGLHQITAGLQLATEKQNSVFANTTLQQIQLARTKGIDPTPIVENTKITNPAVYDLIKDKLPQTTAPANAKSVASRLGTTAKYLGPLGLPYLLEQGVKGIAKKVDSKSLADFWSSLVSE